MCPWGLGYGHFLGRAGGHFVSWGPVLLVRDPNDKKPFWPRLGATGEFSGFFWLIGTAFASRNFLTLTTLGGFTFREIRNLLGFGAVWALREILGLNQQKLSDPKKIEENCCKNCFSLRFQKVCFRRKQSDLCDFPPPFLALGATV